MSLEWTVTGMVWSPKKLWVESSKPTNQYRFESIGTGNESSKPYNQYRFENIGTGDESSWD